jgi:hypothetical protein
MSVSMLSADTTVAAALEANPAIESIFIARRTACIGCYLARFCSLGDSARYYDLPLQTFIDELKLASSDIIVSQGGTNA